MGKLIVVAIIGVIGYVWFQGGQRKPPPPVQAADPVAEITARLKAEQERLRAEEDARGRNSQPAVSAPAPVAKNWQLSNAPAGDPCATARNNVQVTGDWMRQGGTVYEKGSGRTLSENQSFDAAARNRQFIEDNCRRR